MAAAAPPGSQPTTPPLPRSPPKYPDFCGRRRLQLEAQILGREIGYLEEELQSLEGIQSVSRCCKEVNEFIGTNPDPLIPPSKRRHRTCRICTWLGKKLCLCFSWACCFRGCSLGLKRPSCTCSCLKKCCGCDCGFPHCCCCEPSCCEPSCLNFICCRPCCCRNISCCKPHCPKCTGACSCCPKCTGACSCCPKCTGACICCPKCTGACSCCPKCTGACSYCPKCSGSHSCCPKFSGICSCCTKCSLGVCGCWPKCSGACSCCPKCSGACNCCDVSCCIPPRFACPEFSCGCVWSCPECSGVRLCPRCSKPCCISGCLC